MNPPQCMVIGFIGRMGSGKTLNMSKYATYFSQRLHMPVYANYHLVNATVFTDFRELEKMQNIVIAYDEIHIDFDSRDWDKKIRYQFTQWFTQLRKRGIIFLYTAQRHNTLEKRIRENTDYLIMCQRKKHALCEYILDAQLNSQEPTLVNRIINNKPELFYSLYDTREIIVKEFYTNTNTKKRN